MSNRVMVVSPAIKSASGGEDTSKRIVELIENNQFLLLYQLIEPLEAGSGQSRHYEIFVRLIEEEENLMPPGEFFPLAEKYGLMPSLDRWVVKRILGWAAAPHDYGEVIPREGTKFFINLAGATLRDPEFPGFVQKTLQELQMPGAMLCFEIHGSELLNSVETVAGFSYAVRESGCSVAICGFGRDKVSFDLIREIQVDFLKIDGSLIISLHRDQASLSKVTAINQIAGRSGIRTIAEFVEDDATIATLKQIGINFGQGFGISKPSVLEKP